MSPIEVQVARVRRGRWLVLVVMLVAVAGTLFSVLQTGTQYTGRAALSIGSPTRAPEQDSVLAQGYVDYFNEVSNQQRLAQQAGLPAGVTYSARLAASSPIIYVEGVGKDADAVRTGVSGIAQAFRAEVNNALAQDRDARIAALRQQMAVHQAEVDATAPNSQRGTLAAQAVSELQTQISDLQSDATNELQLLQGVAAISPTRPSIALNVGLAVLGGLILGVLAALAVGAARGRMLSGPDVADRLGVEVLADLAVGQDALEQERRLKRLANLVGNRHEPGLRPAIVAVVAPHGTPATEWVARMISRYRAGQGEETIFVATDLQRTAADLRSLRGVADLLADGPNAQLTPLLRPGQPAALRVLPPGVAEGDPYEHFGVKAIRRLFAHVAKQTQGVVVDVSPLLDTAEAQAICAAADRVVLVVEADHTPVADARAALALLAQVDRAPLGAVLVDHVTPELPTVLATQPERTGESSGQLGGAIRRPLRPAARPANPGPLDRVTGGTGNGAPLSLPAPSVPVQHAGLSVPRPPETRPRPRPRPGPGPAGADQSRPPESSRSLRP